MKRALCAILFTLLVASSSQAGYVGQINLASGAGPEGSLGNTLSGLGSVLVGTNLAAPIVTTFNGMSSTTSTLNGYFDFNTGAYTGTDSSGNVQYAAGGNFFVLTGLLPVAAGMPPYASSITTGIATVKSLGITTPSGDAEYQLSMSFTGAYLSQQVASDFGLPYIPLPQGRTYTGDLNFVFVKNDALAGNQLLSGAISFNAPLSSQTAVPEPSSIAMLVVGCLGLAGYGRRQLNRRAS